MLEVEQSTTPAVGGEPASTRVCEVDRAVCRCAQSARWARQFALARWGRLSPLMWLSRVRDGQAMTQGGAIETGIFWPARDWRRLAGVAS
jgi:hypothetical protein